jgi:hypothetical protein
MGFKVAEWLLFHIFLKQFRNPNNTSVMRIFFTVLFLSYTLSGWSQGTLKTENILLITLDGLRWQELYQGADSELITDQEYVNDPVGLKQLFWRDTKEQRREILMPFFWGTIAKQGQLYGNRDDGSYVNCTNQHWFSYPGYNEILCGFADDTRIDSNDKLNNPNTTVLEFLNQQPTYRGSVAAFGSWDVFPFIINEERSGVPVNAGFEENSGALTDREKFLNELQLQIPSPWASVRLDAFTHHYALEYIKRNEPRVVYVAYGETDDFAHGGRYDAYLKSAHTTDAFIRALWDYMQSQPQYRNKTTMIITTDHGRGTTPKDSWRSHGSEFAGTDQIWLAVLGPDTPPSGMITVPQQLYQNQVAATVARFLGLEYTNERPVGKPIKTMF